MHLICNIKSTKHSQKNRNNRLKFKELTLEIHELTGVIIMLLLQDGSRHPNLSHAVRQVCLAIWPPSSIRHRHL